MICAICEKIFSSQIPQIYTDDLIPKGGITPSIGKSFICDDLRHL
jgi:hypothetical protein